MSYNMQCTKFVQNFEFIYRVTFVRRRVIVFKGDARFLRWEEGWLVNHLGGNLPQNPGML